MVKKNGIYYLYYIGADGDRSTDGGPRHRAIGVATSTDGIHFSKYEGNPIITYLPQNNEEEGVFSAAATLDANGDILLYFGGMIAKNQSSTTVSSDILLAISSDGLTFHNPGIVISHADKSVWGRGDELFPLGIYEQNGIRYLYYIAKGIGAQWDLGLALGIDRKTFSDSQPILEKGDDIIGGNVVHAGDGEIFLFLVRDFEQGRIEVRRSDPTSSGQLSPAMDTYDFGNNWRHATVYLDSESSTWFMYHRPRGGNEIYVRTAGLVLNEYEQ
jgi:hypothetical protein